MPKLNEYHTLDEAAILRTVETLARRVAERFPTRGLAQTAAYMIELARKAAREARSLGAPNWISRILAAGALAAGVYAFYTVRDLVPDLRSGPLTASEFAQGLEASFNIVVLVSIALVFLLGLEARFKRRRALGGLYRLRAIAHVIDMHQLTKDPASVVGLERTGSSPERDLTDAQLLRYLDYCSEMLAMTGKLAALYAQHFPDGTVISAVNDIEDLTTGLSRKIWQKIVAVQGGGARD